jgi:clorobiocin biosynthesis protein CloN6
LTTVPGAPSAIGESDSGVQRRDRAAPIVADLILLHAPSVYDFRERDDILFAYLSDSDSVNVTTIYEQYPLGFFAIRQHLRESGISAEIVNVASLMLMYPDLDVDRLLGYLEAPVFGIDLHWLCHCHGAIELSRRIKALKPEALVIVGGISATYYADELIREPSVDVVVQGYDTLMPVQLLVDAARRGQREFGSIPNLLFKTTDGHVVKTGFAYRPPTDYNAAPTDWSFYADEARTGTAPSIMTLPNAGCAHDCPWCGGSRYAFRKIMGVRKTLVTRDEQHVFRELRTLGDAATRTSIYALQCYSETKSRLHRFLDVVKELGYREVYFEQFHLTSPDTLRKMAESTRAHIMLSPESHDPVISRLAGRGTYTMEEMETWIPMALDVGIRSVMVWFFIGMPQQTKESVRETVRYCERLLDKYRGKGVLPLLCPMVPFLDPGSRFFEEPERHGYTIFHKSLADHRQAMVEPLWHGRLNYETKWLARREIQDVTYESIDRLVEVKEGLEILPRQLCRTIRGVISQTTALLAEMERGLALDGRLPPGLRDEIARYNRKILAYSSDQIVPTERPFGGRWFDDFTVPAAVVEAARAT